MKGTKNVLLIFPRMQYVSGDPPLGIGYIATALRKAKFNVSILDTTFHPTFEYLRNFIENFKPDIAGIYVDTVMYNDAIKIIDILKEKKIPVIAGGPHPTLRPDTLIDKVDVLVLKEAEQTFVELSEKYPKIDKILGIQYKKDGKEIKNPERPYVDLNQLDPPALDLLEMEEYIKRWHYMDSIDPNIRGTNMVTSRGCPYRCTYCQPTLNTLFGQTIRRRKAENVIKEIKILKERYNINGIFLHDDTFTIHRPWVMDFCKKLKKANLDITFGCNTRANTLDPEMMKVMHESGLRTLHMGIESGSQRVLDEIYKKDIVLDQAKDIVAEANKLGIHVLGFFMIGAPTETREEIEQTIKFARSLKCDEASFSITSPLPHTALYDYVKEHGYEMSDNFADYNYYSQRAFKDPNGPSFRELQSYQKKALIMFYLHPYRWNYLFNHLTSISGYRKMFNKVKRFL
ncbi:radical SAM protein [Candidatus Woesearchaeota archaeon]|nr:radical SAM protein [Candidatus Woesearchaeota archaeon]